MRVRLRNPDRELTVEGPTTVTHLLDKLDLNPTTVLVIRQGQLVTGEMALGDADDVEIRPVMSGGASDAPRCSDCRAPAVIEEPRHRSAWCGEHFVDHCHRQIRKAIDRYRMFSYADRILVAVSGGKDSLALWDALLAMGYRADGLYLGLGIGGYSTRSGRTVRQFAISRSRHLIEADLTRDYGYSIPQAAGGPGRATCGVCGLSKRYVFNLEAVRGGYDVVVTGHNLDDEAATLLGNMLRWQQGFLARQRPVLPASGGNQVRKAKPLYRLSEREMAAYCVIRGIDYVVEECPLVTGNTGLELKEALNLIERHAPGTKAQFLLGFLDQHADRFDAPGPRRGVDSQAVAAAARGEAAPQLNACMSCGMPTTGQVCAFCRQREHLTATRSKLSPPVAAPLVATAASDPRPDGSDGQRLESAQ